MVKKYWLEIYGCQMNFAEGYALENELSRRGWEPALTAEEADTVILHTCSVRQTAENRIWGRLGYFTHIKQSRSQQLILMGCMAERLKEKIQQKVPAVDLVIGTFGKEYLAAIIDGDADGGSNDFPEVLTAPGQKKPFRFHNYHHRDRDFHAYLPIMHGCNNFCTYCIVPHVRGREVSRPTEEILSEVDHLEKDGVREITLLGQNVNSYSFDDGKKVITFPEILKLVLRRTRHIEWVRFISSHPKDVHPRLIEMIATEPKLCRHVHLPVQHGSSSVLKRMNRKYSREEYLRLIEKMRSSIGELSLTTDIMIGFPGETQDDFEDTLELIREVRFDDAYMYYYNVREGTPAADFDGQLSKQTKLDRLAEVIKVQREISTQKKLARIGMKERVLAESVSKNNRAEILGRTERDQMVVFHGDEEQIGKFFTVRLDQLNGNTFKGSVI